ncbi:MAG: DUF4249 family protein [Aureispira sp.]|nr:DUF4249 family protein [Aureispira sp.]
MRSRSLVAGILLVIVAVFSQCSNEIEVIGAWKEIPIVYGILEQGPGPHYIRIEKAYLPPDTSAYSVAQKPDSIYFGANDIEVELFMNGALYETLERINLDTVGLPKDSGTFAKSPNIAYRMNKTVIAQRDFQLLITNLKTGETYSSEESSMRLGSPNSLGYSEFGIVTPSSFKALQWSDANFEMKDVRFDWRKEETGAAIYDLTLRFHYGEFQVDAFDQEINGTREFKYMDWMPVQSIYEAPSVAQSINGSRFYDFVANNFTDITGTNTRRCVVSMDVIVDGATPSLAEYIKANSANSGLIGGLYPLEPYSNVEGGYGMLAFKKRIIKSLDLDSDVALYLNTIPEMKSLGFVGYKCFK